MRDVAITRVQYTGPPRRSRNLEERLMVRFPGAWRALAALSQRLLSPGSRLRRAMLRRNVVSGWDAFNRRDFKLMLVRFAPDVVAEFDPDYEALGLGGTFRGHDGLIKMFQAFGEAWDQWEARPAAILDLGDRVLVLGTNRFSGNVSGLELEREFAELITLRDGLVAHERQFLAWDQGLRAAGIEPDAVALPVRGRASQTASSAG